MSYLLFPSYVPYLNWLPHFQFHLGELRLGHFKSCYWLLLLVYGLETLFHHLLNGHKIAKLDIGLLRQSLTVAPPAA
jgi:hypothetical protein